LEIKESAVVFTGNGNGRNAPTGKLTRYERVANVGVSGGRSTTPGIASGAGGSRSIG
jgi:hypothetical protein